MIYVHNEKLKKVSSVYSKALLQQNNLLDLGYNSDISSAAQKIYNIDDIKFFVCYNKKDGYTFSLYCILGDHESEGTIIIKNY